MQLDAVECGTGLVVERGILLRFLMEFDIKIHKLARGVAVFDDGTVAPAFVGNYHLAELGAPVAKVVDADGMIAEMVVYPPEGVAEHGGGDMVYAERLGDVDGGIVEADVPAVPLIGGAVFIALFEHGFDDGAREGRLIGEKVEIAAGILNAVKAFDAAKLFSQLRSDERRSLSQRLCQLKAGEGKIAHIGIGRSFKHFGSGRDFKTGVLGDRFRKLHSEIHMEIPFVLRVSGTFQRGCDGQKLPNSHNAP